MMRNPSFLYSLVLLIHISLGNLSAQLEIIAQYTIEDGLPSNIIYDLVEDNKGKLWIATDKGIARWNGYEFTLYGKTEGLPNNSIWALHRDKQDRIWCLNNTNPACYIYNDTVYQLPFEYSGRISYSDIILLDDGLAYISNQMTWMHTDSTYTSYRQIKKELDSQDNEAVIWHQSLLHLNGNNDYDNIIKALEEEDSKVSETRWLTSMSNIPFYISRSSNVVKKLTTRPSQIKYKTNLGVLHPPLYKNGLLYLQGKKGLLLIDIHLMTIIQQHEFPTDFKHSRSILFKNYIISGTLDNGLCLYQNNHSKSSNDFRIEICNSNNSSILEDSTNYYIATKENTLPVPKTKTDHFLILKKPNNCILLYLNKIFLASSAGDVNIQKLQKHIKGINLSKEFSTGAMIAGALKKAVINKDYFFGIDGKYLWYDEQTDNKFYLKSKECPASGITTLHQDVLVSIENEIYKIKDSTLSTSIYKSPDSMDIRDIISTQSKLIFHTDKNIFSAENNKISHILKLNQEIENLNVFDSIIIFNDDKTIHYLNPSTSEHLQYSKKMWVPFNKINNIILKNDILSIVGNTKISTINLDPKLAQTNQLRLELEIEINEEKSKYESKFSTKSRNLNFNIRCSSTYSQGQVDYFYRLLPGDTMWTRTRSRDIRLSSLAANEYSLEVKARDLFGVKSGIYKYEFHVTPFWYETLWFYAILVISSTLLTYFVLARSTKRNAAREAVKQQLKKQISTTQLEALRSQMNPHFVFNSLAAIQNYIRQSKKEEADDYLTMFAQLIRSFFEYSQKPTITIQKEIELINKYVSLENLRFQNEIDYQVDIAPEVDLYQEIPSLILQPFVENAIHHGLFHKKGVKQLSLKVTEVQDVLLFEVKDNGIGREKSAEFRSKKHKSKGTQIMQERFDTINATGPFQIKSNISDYTNPTGTLITITIKNINT